MPGNIVRKQIDANCFGNWLGNGKDKHLKLRLQQACSVYQRDAVLSLTRTKLILKCNLFSCIHTGLLFDAAADQLVMFHLVI